MATVLRVLAHFFAVLVRPEPHVALRLPSWHTQPERGGGSGDED
jgi:hypothetical protein